MAALSRRQQALQLVEASFTDAAQKGILHLHTEDEALNGRTVRVHGRDLLNFGSCSYLALELDPRIKAAAIDAIERYGVVFSSSRSYMGVGLHVDLHERLDRLFDAHTVVTATTTLGHLANIPILFQEDDAVILDRQVHASIQMAVQLHVAAGGHVASIPHSNLEALERKVQVLSKKYRRVWYCIDGIYSMYGDPAPLARIRALMDRYEALHLYMDDAHGMSWDGPNGSGYGWGTFGGKHERMVLAVSLCKGFGGGGGVLVFPDPALAHRVRTCGGPLVFGGPVPPMGLAASIASADIHLSPEILDRQQALQTRIRHVKNRLVGFELPLTSLDPTPISFVGVGETDAAVTLAKRLQQDGFYVNVSAFPAVPLGYAGIRFTTTLYQSLEEIDQLTERLAFWLPLVLEPYNQTVEGIRAKFAAILPNEANAPVPIVESEVAALSQAA